MESIFESVEDRSAEELLKGLKKSLKQASEDKSRSWTEVKKDFEQNP